MNYYEIVKRLIGKIEPLGCSDRDLEHLRKLEETCDLISQLIADVEFVARYRDSKEYSVSQAGKFAHRFLEENGLNG